MRAIINTIPKNRPAQNIPAIADTPIFFFRFIDEVYLISSYIKHAIVNPKNAERPVPTAQNSGCILYHAKSFMSRIYAIPIPKQAPIIAPRIDNINSKAVIEIPLASTFFILSSPALDDGKTLPNIATVPENPAKQPKIVIIQYIHTSMLNLPPLIVEKNRCPYYSSCFHLI